MVKEAEANKRRREYNKRKREYKPVEKPPIDKARMSRNYYLTIAEESLGLVRASTNWDEGIAELRELIDELDMGYRLHVRGKLDGG